MAKINLEIPIKAQALRELSDEELGKQVEVSREKLYHLRYKMHVEEVENPNLKSVIRRNIARMMTVQQERQTGAQEVAS